MLDTSNSIVAFEGHAPAAAEWILVSGRRLYDECKARAEWTTWIADLAWIIDQNGLDEEIKSSCQEALIVMERIHSLC